MRAFRVHFGERVLENGMKCHVALVGLLCCGACASESPAEGSVLSQRLGGLESTAHGLNQVEEFVLAPGDTPLSVRVRWTLAKTQSMSTHPFGMVDVDVERNEIGAAEVQCALGEPALATLLNGDRVWNVDLRCSFRAEGQEGEAHGLLWANGLFTQRP